MYSKDNGQKHKKKVAIIQSNYIPWKGYFDIINSVDEFIILDTVQYTQRDWRNRNKIKTPTGERWLTIPVLAQDRSLQKIKDTKIADPAWGQKHWAIINQCYRQTPYFKEFKNTFEDLYLNSCEEYLSEINFKFIKAVNKILNIPTKISWTDISDVSENKTQRLLTLCKKANAQEYLSGPSAKDYLDADVFQKEGIPIAWMDYSNYPEYPQAHPPFVHAVSIIDLIFNVGHAAPQFIQKTQPNLSPIHGPYAFSCSTP